MNTGELSRTLNPEAEQGDVFFVPKQAELGPCTTSKLWASYLECRLPESRIPSPSGPKPMHDLCLFSQESRVFKGAWGVLAGVLWDPGWCIDSGSYLWQIILGWFIHLWAYVGWVRVIILWLGAEH